MFSIRYRLKERDDVARAWIYCDVQAEAEGRGWITIGEVGNPTHVGREATFFDRSPA